MSETNDLNTDEVQALIELDELSDARLLTPRDFAKLYGCAPQLVYYYIRTKKLDIIVCDCGRKCVEVEAARKFMDNRGKESDAEGS
jgi:hypothetical protein